MEKVPVKHIKQSDAAWKGPRTDETSSALQQLWEDSSSGLTLGYLQDLGLGNRKNQRHPFEASITKRVIDAMSVVYNVPATRALAIDDAELDDDDMFTYAMNKAFTRTAYDLVWQRIDAARNLFRTACVEWSEDHASGCVGAMLYGPHQVFRCPDPSAPHAIERDDAVLLQVRWSLDERENLYRAWIRDGSAGMWRCWIVNEGGEPTGEQPYGDDGSHPLGDMLPLQLVHDEHPMFRAWLPVPESRVSWALGINSTINDLAFLVSQEAHTIKVFRTEGGPVPTEIGPDAILKAPLEGGLDALSTSPKIMESIQVLDQQLRLFAVSEYLPGNIFDSSYAQAHTGQALRVANQHLAQRRWRQLQLMPTQENKAWSIYSRLHNTFRATWGAEMLPENATMRAYAGRGWMATDAREQQELAFKNMAAGLISRVMLCQELLGMTRQQAIEHLERVRRDEGMFPAAEFQNAGAMVDDRPAALGEGSASKNRYAFNPDIASSTEGASVVDAISQDHS